MRQLLVCVFRGSKPTLLQVDRKASDWERQKAIEIAQQVLQGQITTLKAVRELVSRADTDAIQNETDRRLIIGIDSDTDHLPVGAVRFSGLLMRSSKKTFRLRVPKHTAKPHSWTFARES